MSGTVDKSCRWSLRHASHWYCRYEAARSPVAPFMPVDLGCPDECPTREAVPGKSEAYPDDAPQPETVEWEDEDEE